MKTFQEIRDSYRNQYYLPLYEEIQKYLEEKLLIVGKGQNTGQAVILAGGAGSGKSFAVNQMIGGQYKIFNPDDIKDTLVKMRDNIKAGKTNFPTSTNLLDLMDTIKDLNLRNPNDTGMLHMAVKGLSLDQRRMQAFFMTDKTKSVLPNVLFDATMKDITQLLGDADGFGILEFLKHAGYKPENIHIIWILTDYRIALRQNLTRDRVVPAEILFKTHSGASKTMQDIMFRDYRRLGVNGDVSIIIGGKTTVTYQKGSTIEKDGKIYTVTQDTQGPIVKDFKYFRVKLAGSQQMNPAALTAVQDFIKQFAPKPNATPEKELKKVINAIGKKKTGKKIHATTAKALDIPLDDPAVDKKTIPFS